MSEKTELIPIIGTDDDNRRADIVFVHGLGGHGRGTWHPQEKKGDEDNDFWPFWLGEDLKDVGVWSLNYEVEPTQWKGNGMPLGDRAINVLAILDLEEIGDRPVVFVTHSMGGLLVKQMLRHAIDYNDPRWKNIVDRTGGIVFLSTPHSGAALASWTNYINIAGILRKNVSLQELEAHHPRLRELNKVYRERDGLRDIKIEVYFETEKTMGFLVVDPTSADPSIAGVTPIPVDSNHINICKPKSRRDPVYRRVKRFIRERLIPVLIPTPPKSVQLKQELQLLNQIDEALIDDKDTILANAKLRQWKKRATSLIGCPDLYDIQPDQNQKTPYNQTRNIIKQSRKFVQNILKEAEESGL